MNITDNLREKKYVAFLDVLGFKELVYGESEKLNLYFTTITKALEDIYSDKPKIDFQLVSDSIILACPLTKSDFILLLTAIQTIQARCSIKNIWIRGAISIGNIYFNRNNNIVVGSGLINSYLLESHEKYPRVIIDPKIISEGGFGTREMFMQDNNSIISNGLMSQRNPLLIHDYRFVIGSLENDSFFVTFAEKIAFDNPENLTVIYSNIQSELYKGQQNYSKYLWLKNYFTISLEIFAMRYEGGANPNIHAQISEIAQKFQYL